MAKFIAGAVLALLFSTQAFASVVVVQVPEPSTMGLLAIGVAGVVIAARLRNRK